MTSEKQAESELTLALEDFKGMMFHIPSENPFLQRVLKDASKRGKCNGIPDRLIYCPFQKVLIVIECKKDSLQKALNDLMVYKDKMNLSILDEFSVYFVSFVSRSEYQVYDFEFKQLNWILTLDTFNLNTKCHSSKMQLRSDIHTIHNYIRNNTKMSDSDKPYFIAMILISLRNKMFRTLIDNYNTKEYIYDLLAENLKEFDLDVSVFQFLRNDKNNVHFLSLIKMCRNIVDHSHDVDILNEFFTEFLSYYSTDSKSLGIVLTPSHIVELMTYMLDINDQDVVLDLCTGTGSFLLESWKYNPRKIIGCEFQTKLFSLLKSNMILRDIPKERYSLFMNDCFEISLKATKSIINAPYGTKPFNELDFILKQLESVDEGGMVISILPIGKINASSSKRTKIYQAAKIRAIIECNPLLFSPTASVHCCIILLEKSSKGHSSTDDVVKIIDYNDDGIENVIGSGRCKNRILC